MKALLFNTLSEAEEFSHERAVIKGCHSITTLWYPIKDTTTNKFAVIVDDDLTTYDAEGNAVEHPDVVDVTGLLLTSTSDEF